MKRRCVVGEHVGDAGAFPGRIAGASLKRDHAGHGFVGADRFPRQNRRGLIEAWVSPPEPPLRQLAFPGRIAGASLKRVQMIRITAKAPGLSPAESPGPH